VSQRQLFDHVAAAYDAHRPDYPPQLFDALESAMGRPLLRAHVLDVGAGTGIATRALAGRGAEVVALDPGPGVIGVLRARSTSRVTAVVGDGNALPVRSSVFDLVTYAQSWHWTDPGRSLPEAVRVLRPGGVFAAFWNILQARQLPWWEPFVEICERLCPGYRRDMFEVEGAPELADVPLWRWLRRVDIPWTRELTVDDLVADYGSHSYVAALGSVERDTVLGVLREGAHSAFPDGLARLPYVTRTWVARR
jgi:SAM-dependent methyltransferase